MLALNNKCKICGKPCKVKYCDDCRKKAYKQYQKECHFGKKVIKYKGCNEDCLNCPYPDCLKPVKEMKSEHLLDVARPSEEESAPHIFTLELGGYGGARPNLNRKFYY